MGNFPAAQECSPSHFLGLEKESGERERVRELRLMCVASAPLPVPGVRNDKDPQQESQKEGRLPSFPPAITPYKPEGPDKIVHGRPHTPCATGED